MSMSVYRRVEQELARRADAREQPGNWASLGRRIGATAQRMHGWKHRGIPDNVGTLRAIADAFGWSLSRLLGDEDATPVRSAAAPLVAAPLVAAPLVAATDSELAGLDGLGPEDLRYLPADELAAVRERVRLWKLRAQTDVALGLRTVTRVTPETAAPTPPVAPAKKRTK